MVPCEKSPFVTRLGPIDQPVSGAVRLPSTMVCAGANVVNISKLANTASANTEYLVSNAVANDKLVNEV